MVRYLAVLLCLLSSPSWAQTFFPRNQTPSWFSNDSPPANIQRFNDLLFVGDAAQNYSGASGCPTGDWFTTFEATTTNGSCAYISTFESVILSKTNNSNAGGGLLVGGQSANVSSATNGSFGVAAFGLENKAGAGSRNGGATWALYGECDKTVNNGGNCYGVELDVMTSVNISNQPDPFTQGPVIGGQIACGSGVTTPTNFHCSAGLQVVANSQPFNVGINFLSGSIASTSLFGGSASPAIVMPENYGIVWYSAAGTPAAGITVDALGNVNIVGNKLVFNGTQVTVP